MASYWTTSKPAATIEDDATSITMSRNASQEDFLKHGEYTGDFDLATDPAQDHRATEIKIFSIKGPHMRAFHASWIGFFSAFMAWFAIAPLMSLTIKKALHLTPHQVYVSNICALASTVGMRFICGPLCDMYGPRTVMAAVLVICSLPTFLIGTVTTFEGLCIVRFFIGTIGSTFIMNQYWTAAMFADNVVGTANAIAGGWGNLGGGVTQLLMGSAIYPLFLIFNHGDSNLAWRSCFVVPAMISVICGICIYYLSVDCPYGNYADLKKTGRMPQYKAGKSVIQALLNPNCILMGFMYAAAFGTELTMDNNLAALYAAKPFLLKQSDAAATAFSYGFMNIFSRALGGYVSDLCNRYLKLRGRLLVIFLYLLFQGGFLVLFSYQTKLAASITVLQFFAIFNEGACGAIYAVVPYLEPENQGPATGIVGAGGNLGAIFWGLIFLYNSGSPTSLTDSMRTLGWICMACAGFSFFIRIPGHAMLIGGVEDDSMKRSNSKLNIAGAAPIRTMA